ncbi:MAG: hypothetical protein LM550_16710 [Candidatus Contendobacter sp.]|jgi:hypothetical protein|nr:hypothetical protein [Gammaproteobacteria bacterium]MCC8995284.1 hypothetical protein [Candidatus Contendobacter sp.]
MRQQSREYIVILFIIGALALNYPVLGLFDRSASLFGIPLLYFYLYMMWLILIILLIAVVQHSEVREPEQPKPQPSSPTAGFSERRRTDETHPGETP